MLNLKYLVNEVYETAPQIRTENYGTRRHLQRSSPVFVIEGEDWKTVPGKALKGVKIGVLNW